MKRWLLFFSLAIPGLLPGMLACNAGSSGGAPSQVHLVSSTGTMTYSTTLIQKTRTASVTFQNNGIETGQITDMVGLNTPFVTTVPSSFPFAIPVQGTATVTIRFAPTASGTYTDSVVIHTNDPQNPIFTLEMTGSCVDLGTETTPLSRMYSASRPVGLSSNRALITTTGPDGVLGNADDLIVLIDSSGSFSTTTSVAVRGLSTAPTILSDTRVMAASSGPDLTYNTSDDEIVLIDFSGPSPVTTLIPIPGLSTGPGTRPVRKTGTSAHVVSSGPDLTFSTADDRIYTIDLSPAVPDVTFKTVAYLSTSLTSMPVDLFDSSIAIRIVLGSPGPDGAFGTADDEIVNFDGTTTRRDTVGPLDPDKSQYVVLQGPQYGLAATPGANGVFGDTDDRVLMIDSAIGGIIPISVPNILSIPVRITNDRFIIATEGPDSVANTADDTIYVIRDRTVPDIQITVGNLNSTRLCEPLDALTSNNFFIATTDGRLVEGSATSTALVGTATLGGLLGEASQPVVRDSTSLFVASAGPDNTYLTADDRITFVDFSENPVAVIAKTAAGLDSDSRSRPVVISSSYALVSTAGPTLTFNTSDDAVIRFGPIPQ